MIGKVMVNKSFGTMCRYVLQEKTPMAEAEVLAAHGVRIDSAAHMAADFDAVRALRPGLGKAVLHVALAFPAEEASKLTNEVMGRIAQDYLTGMRIDPENTQWAVVRHQDKEHPHMHLIVNRVDLDGQTVSDQFCRSRSVDVCKRIERDYKLIVADEVGHYQARAISPTPKQIKAATPREEQAAEWSRVRQEIGRALGYTVKEAHSFDELSGALQRRGIRLELMRRKDGSAAGVVFEKDGHRVKGSQVGREYSAGNLEAGFAQAHLLKEHQKETPKVTLQQLGEAYAQAKRAAEQAQKQTQQQIRQSSSRGHGIGD